jgi:hypothetical protein
MIVGIAGEVDQVCNRLNDACFYMPGYKNPDD